MKKVDVLVISISNPLLVGIYEDNNLVESISNEGKTSDVLPSIFEKLLAFYDIKNIFYVNGPGSFMSIKVTYLFLRSLSIVKNIPLKAASGFIFNNNSPIKALGKKYFFNINDDKIKVDFLEENIKIYEFQLPQKLDYSLFSSQNEPNYNLPAVN